jgi:hypothetical protein
LANPKTGSPVPRIPIAAALGPDGDLYIGDIRDGAILRIVGAATFDPQNDCPSGTGFTGQDPTKKLQIPILAHDSLFGSGHTFGLGWVGHTLIGADNIAPWVAFNADQCLTPVNGNTTCGSPVVGGAPLPNEILASAAGAPQGGLASDAQYPNFPGNSVYVASFPNLTRVTNILSATSMTANLSYGGSFSFLTGVTADPEDPGNAIVYAQDDETQGGINGTGRIWRITPAPAAPGPPLAPSITAASAPRHRPRYTRLCAKRQRAAYHLLYCEDSAGFPNGWTANSEHHRRCNHHGAGNFGDHQRSYCWSGLPV